MQNDLKCYLELIDVHATSPKGLCVHTAVVSTQVICGLKLSACNMQSCLTNLHLLSCVTIMRSVTADLGMY